MRPVLGHSQDFCATHNPIVREDYYYNEKGEIAFPEPARKRLKKAGLLLPSFPQVGVIKI